MPAPGPSPSTLATAARMLAEGATQAETAKAVGTTDRSLRRWQEQGLLDDVSVPGDAGADVLRSMALKPNIADRERIAAASALARIESLDRDLGENAEPQVVNLLVHHRKTVLDALSSLPGLCPSCRAVAEESLAPNTDPPPKTCRMPNAHLIVDGYADPNRPGKFINRRHCRCPL